MAFLPLSLHKNLCVETRKLIGTRIAVPHKKNIELFMGFLLTSDDGDCIPEIGISVARNQTENGFKAN